MRIWRIKNVSRVRRRESTLLKHFKLVGSIYMYESG
jgi:hypothetical protein